MRYQYRIRYERTGGLRFTVFAIFTWLDQLPRLSILDLTSEAKLQIDSKACLVAFSPQTRHAWSLCPVRMLTLKMSFGLALCPPIPRPEHGSIASCCINFLHLFTAALASLCSFLHHSFEVLHVYPMVKARTFLHSQRIFWSHTIIWFWTGIAYNLVDYIISTLPQPCDLAFLLSLFSFWLLLLPRCSIVSRQRLSGQWRGLRCNTFSTVSPLETLAQLHQCRTWTSSTSPHPMIQSCRTGLWSVLKHAKKSNIGTWT